MTSKWALNKRNTNISGGFEKRLPTSEIWRLLFLPFGFIWEIRQVSEAAAAEPLFLFLSSLGPKYRLFKLF